MCFAFNQPGKSGPASCQHRNACDPMMMQAYNHTIIRGGVQLPRNRSAEPLTNVGGGTWNVSSPDAVERFSMIGYLLARYLRYKLKVPPPAPRTCVRAHRRPFMAFSC